MTKKFKILLAGLLLGVCAIQPIGAAFAAAAAGEEAPASRPAESNTVSAESSWTPEQIDAYAEAAMERLHIPGLAIGIVRGGEVLYTQGYGSAGPGAGPMTPQTPLPIGSTTKSFTALAVMQLVEDGRIDLNAPVADYLPDFRLADAAASGRITVADLLHQTSGLSTYDGVAFLGEGNGTLMQHVRSLKRVSQTQPAGAGYQYSNLNYNILGAIVQQVSGETYGDYIEERIMRPLEMNDSFSSPERAAVRLSEHSELRPPSGHQPVFGLTVPTRLMHHSGTVPSGYLVSTAEDMSKYLIMQMNGGTMGGTRLLSEDGIQRMHAPAADMGGGSFYGMGWVSAGDSLSHNGTTENTYSEMRIRDGYGFFVLANSVDPLIVSYAGILPGLDDLVHGQTPALDSLPDFVKLYAIADSAVVVMALLFAWSVRSLFRWRKAFRPAPWKIALNTVLLLVCNAAFPLLLLRFVSGLAPWNVVVTWAPGIGWGLAGLPWLLFATGAIKLALMLAAIAGRKRTVPAVPESRAA
ncbi:serine hydrolase domain-containing protein [Saccharibacillus sp. CPCC 101409]|uniref:serine hydrolase domain-containing protein n=1 Tax=Saccharibacillus sp. CPCC 101409 TaxID=3058041 RepID=UPI002673123A|nr:serine hydrolase domain-containing protein [Saccharibacillus sp. CPCC 101409]MDO3411119.1 serine hydrolase domain-containing protein [Saccharibacillus sp. CPCC 101409]